MKINSSIFSSISHAIKKNPVKNAANKINNFLTKISRIKNDKETLAPPVKFLKTFSIDYDSKAQQFTRTGFLSHFGQYQEPAIFIHGTGTHRSDGKGIDYFKGSSLDDINFAGEEADYKSLTIKEFVAAVKKDFNLDLHRSGNTGTSPLHLICCFSGSLDSDSMGGELARELNRSVITYGNNTRVYIFDELKDKIATNSRIYAPEEKYPNGIPKPLKPIIHFPDNRPGQFRE